MFKPNEFDNHPEGFKRRNPDLFPLMKMPPFTEEHRANMSIAQKERAERPGESERRSADSKAWHSKNEHPKGFKGHRRTPQDIQKIKDGIAKAWADPKHKVNSKEFRQRISDNSSTRAAQSTAGTRFSRCAKGMREDIGISVRSSWEANYARYLNFLIKTECKIERWEYETETFWFEKIKRGCRSWKPDFKVIHRDGKVEYHEVKGWMYPRARTALKRMRIYHPGVCVVLIDQARYLALSKQLRAIIPNWELPTRGPKSSSKP